MIRKMTSKDLNEVLAYETSIFKLDGYSLETLNKFVYDENVLNLVVDEDSKLVGYINISYFEDTANILKIAVDKDERKKGIGFSLLEESIKLLKEKGVCKLFLEVEFENSPAIGLYKKFNFKNIRTRKNYYKNGGDAIEMMLDL